MRNYTILLKKILAEGESRPDRTGTGTLSLFGESLEYDLVSAFPLLRLKKVSFKNIVTELLWFISGDTNVRSLQEQGNTIWDEWADPEGNLGPVYGAQWRNFDGIDQLQFLIRDLRKSPHSRRHILSAWNVGELNQMALAPCHMMAQFYVSHDNRLSCQMYQRSADMFLGVPYNIASYALLTQLLARECDLGVGNLKVVFGDCHIYFNHINQCRELIRRMEAHQGVCPPSVDISSERNIFNITLADFHLYNYNPMPAIKADVSV